MPKNAVPRPKKQPPNKMAKVVSTCMNFDLGVFTELNCFATSTPLGDHSVVAANSKPLSTFRVVRTHIIKTWFNQCVITLLLLSRNRGDLYKNAY